MLLRNKAAEPIQAIEVTTSRLRIPVNVTVDSGIVPGLPVNVTAGVVLRDSILWPSCVSAVLPFL